LRRRRLLALAVPALLALAGCDRAADSPPDQPPLAGAAIGGPFTLADKAGKPVHWSDFAGRWRIVYFGYTFCPDACPTDVTVAVRGLDMFSRAHPAQGARIVPLFITIDPERDTPAIVGQFAAAFSPRLIGLTGTPAQVAQAAKEFGVYYQRGKQTPGGYLMDHSRVAYLMDANGAPIAMLPIEKGPQAVAAELATWVR
jgi:protein SCO1/2